MAVLGRLVTEAIVLRWGPHEMLRRLAHPFWFQSFGAVMGMDWHSSGITTSVVGALKRGLEPVGDDLGLHVCGGRGRHSRKTPGELAAVGERTGVDGAALARCSRLVAKVDSAALQDGFQVYLHSFVVADDGEWAVVQQGMAPERREARRYHWLSEGLESFVDQPHSAVEGEGGGQVRNLVDHRAEKAREASVELVNDGPDGVVELLRKARGSAAQPVLPHLALPAHHEVRESDVVLRRLRGNLAAAADRGPEDFSELLLVQGVGPRTVEALALVSEVVHGAPSRFSDPARFSYAHGGKDGHPFPVPLKVYDETIKVMREAVDRARLGNDDRLHALRKLDLQSRILERAAGGLSWEQLVTREREESWRYGGRTVMGPAREAAPRKGPGRKAVASKQARLPGL